MLQPQVRDRDLTHTNLPNTMPGVKATGDMLITFSQTQVLIENADPAKKGSYETRLTIKRQPKGDRQTASVRFISEEQAQKMYPVEYAHYVATGEVPSEGTPLSELPGISKSQIDLLVLYGIRSIEDVLAVGPDRMQSLGYHADRAYHVAKQWDQRRKDSAEVITMADVEAKMAHMMKDSERRVAAAEERAKSLEAQLAAMQRLKGVDVTADQPTAVDNDDSADLETEVANMPNPWGDGDDLGDAGEMLDEDQIDPLA